MDKKEKAFEVLKKVLRILNSKEYRSIFSCITKTDIGELSELPAFLEEFVQGTVELNGYDKIDEFNEENYYTVDDTYENGVAIDYVLTADHGHELPICIRLEVFMEEILLSIFPC